MMITLFLLGLASCGELHKVRSHHQERAIDVCEALKGIKSYRGTKVSIRGIYWGGLQGNCKQTLSTGGYVWPSALNLVDSHYALQTDNSVAFQTDSKSWDRLDSITLSTARSGRRQEIWATFTGQLIAPNDHVRPDGKVAGGYGHLGTLPAELVVERVTDIEVRDVPTYDYGSMLRSRAK